MESNSSGTELRMTSSGLSSGRGKGFLMVLTSGTFWGLSGTAAQRLMQQEGFTTDWLVTMRMGVSGLLLLLFVLLRTRNGQVFAIWKTPKDWVQLFIFTLFGLFGVQYAYFASIAAGNAATATFLQYLGPSMIVIFLALRIRRMPSRNEFVALALALIGTLLLVTNGSIHVLIVPPLCVFWGVLSAVALAFYTLYPAGLLKRYSSATVIGWAMLIGGAVFSLFSNPFHNDGQHWSILTFGLVAFVILFGTLLAFYLYLASMTYIAPSESSVLAGVEPLSAAIASTIFLHVPLGIATIVGGICIMATVVILARKK